MTGPSPELFDRWSADEATAEAMVPLIGRLYRERDVIISIYGRKLVRASAVEILRAHRYVRQVGEAELSVSDTNALLSAMAGMELSSAKVDLGRLTTDFVAGGRPDAVEFLETELASLLTGAGRLLDSPTDVVLYGFGRIGRLVARILIDRTGSGAKLRLRAIVLRPGSADDLAKRASLLQLDSVHGPFKGTIRVDADNHQIIANGNPIQIIYASNPESVDYEAHGIDDAVVIDNTGIWRDRENLERHLQSSGASRVVLTAPGKGDLKNIIYGVNHSDMDVSDRVLSAASCTTNAIVPPLKVLNEAFGIRNGHVETVHAYTNDQNLTDNFHSKARRGRSAPLNMVITETGAATAVVKALPELAGKLTGNAIRVPVPNVSLAILNLNLETATTVDELNMSLRSASVGRDLDEQVGYTTSTEVVSSDIVGTDRSCIVDSCATIVDGDRCTVYVWYDNEAGYSYQVVRLVQDLAGLRYPRLP